MRKITHFRVISIYFKQARRLLRVKSGEMIASGTALFSLKRYLVACEGSCKDMKFALFPERWLFPCFILVGMAVIFAGCSTHAASTNSATPSPTFRSEATATSSATVEASVPCQSRQLLLTKGNVISALSNAGLEFSFENRSGVSCTLFGYPSLQLLDAQKKPLMAMIGHSTAGYLYIT